MTNARSMTDWIKIRGERFPGSTSRLFYGTAGEVRAQRAAAAKAAGSELPKGIGKGKVAAIVAGVALAGGALYMLTRDKKEDPQGQWTEKVRTERENAAGLAQTR